MKLAASPGSRHGERRKYERALHTTMTASVFFHRTIEMSCRRRYWPESCRRDDRCRWQEQAPTAKRHMIFHAFNVASHASLGFMSRGVCREATVAEQQERLSENGELLGYMGNQIAAAASRSYQRDATSTEARRKVIADVAAKFRRDIKDVDERRSKVLNSIQNRRQRRQHTSQNLRHVALQKLIALLAALVNGQFYVSSLAILLRHPFFFGRSYKPA